MTFRDEAQLRDTLFTSLHGWLSQEYSSELQLSRKGILWTQQQESKV